MITTTKYQDSSDRWRTPSLSSLSAVSAAAALLIADAAFPKPTLAGDSSALARSSDQASRAPYSVSDLERLESFAQFLGQGNTIFSSMKAREAVFTFLKADGVLDAMPLHPLERRALELLRDNDLDAVRFAILKSRAHLAHGTFSESDVFRGLTTSHGDGIPSSRDLSQEIAADYRNLLGFCQVIAGRLVLTSDSTAPSDTQEFLLSLSPKRATTIMQTVGALVLKDRLSSETYAGYFGERLLASQAEVITSEESARIPILKFMDRYSSHPWLLRAFILSQGALCYGLFRAFTRRAQIIDAQNPAQEES